MRKPLIAANWKMNFTVDESVQFVSQFSKRPLPIKKTDIVLCPPYTSLYSLSVILAETEGLYLGAQNCHWEAQGAYTGEISPAFLRALECSYVISGHSERRQIFGERDDLINRKILAALKEELRPIFCVGETGDERAQGQTRDVILGQLEKGLDTVAGPDMHEIVIAYEPVWAIGTGRNATPEQAQEIHALIRSFIKAHFDAGIADDVRIIYGGSVKPGTMKGLMGQADIDGALVGGASLDVDSFCEIVNY